MHISAMPLEQKTANNLALTELKRDGYHQHVARDAKILNLVGLGNYQFITKGKGDTVWCRDDITLVVRDGAIKPRL